MNPVARTHGLVVQDVLDETLVYDLTTHQACCLNPSAAAVWKLCDGGHSVGEIANELHRVQDLHLNEAGVLLAIEQLAGYNLLDSSATYAAEAWSRRRAIKALAAGSVIALPSVTALAMSQRGIASTCACVNAGSCINYPSCPSTTYCNSLGVCAPEPGPAARS